MPAFNLEHDQRRLMEAGLSDEAKVQSTYDNVRTLINERTGMPSHFDMLVGRNQVTSIGYEQRGDISNSFEKSVQEATKNQIAVRYAMENLGFEEVKKNFFTLPLHSTILMFSPPPDKPIPGYPGHSMAYFYHIQPGENKDERNIRAVAWINNFSKEEQADLLNDIRGEEEVKVQPYEGSILTSPASVMRGFSNDTESFRTIWGKIGQKFLEKEHRNFVLPPTGLMETILLRGDKFMKEKFPELDSVMMDLAERVSRGETQSEIAEQFNIMLNMADQQLLYKDLGKFEEVTMKPVQVKEVRAEESPPPPVATILQRNRHLRTNVRTVDTTCDVSGGMAVGEEGEASEAGVTSWSFKAKKEGSGVDAASIIIETKTLECTCPFCNEKVNAKIGGGKITCTNEDCGKSAPYNC